MFVRVFRCKMCGDIIEEKGVHELAADIEVMEEHGKKRHNCFNGDMGVVEFIGFKKEHED